MGVIAAAAGLALMGAALVWEGVKGINGKPDETGRPTSKGTAYALVVVGVLVAAGGAILPFVIDKLI
jgi:hypothetical protein